MNGGLTHHVYSSDWLFRDNHWQVTMASLAIDSNWLAMFHKQEPF